MSAQLPEFVADAFAVRGQSVLVTGAAGLIGSAIARAFAVNGARVVLSDLAGDDLEQQVHALRSQGLEAKCVAADLTVPAELEQLIAATVAAHGRLDALINCGAITRSGRMLDEDTAAFDRIQATNVRSVWLLTRAAIAPMREHGGGTIVNVASVNGHRAQFFCSAYAASKAAVLALTRELSVELAPHAIRVNAVSPGHIHHPDRDTRWLQRFLREEHRAQVMEEARAVMREQGMQAQPLHQSGEAIDVALACIYLCSPAARFITGTDLVVDGGKLHEMPDCEPRFHDRRGGAWEQFRDHLRALPADAWLERPKWL